MYVKICANRSIEDAKMCIEAGADFLGNFGRAKVFEC